MELETFKSTVDAWLDENATALARAYEGIGTLDEQMAQLRKVMRMAFDAGFMRMGWPERVGGLGGSNLLRAYLGETLTFRELVEPGIFSMPEVLAPTMIDYAPEALAAEMVPKLLRGDEIWCQGFSEPGTGSNLGSIVCRATRTDGGWRVNGQKVWTSLAQYAQRCVLLTRTGTPESAHRGITALFVDMESPGITVRPIETMHGAREFCEVFFDDVVVPLDRILGEEDRGWSIAMDLLPFERSTALWHRAAYLQRRLQQLVSTVPQDALSPTAVGEATELLWAFRARSRSTQRRLAAGDKLGPETSVDKVLVATAEQAVFDLVAEGLGPEVTTGDDPVSRRWRAEFLYSRAATIYGGSAEIQRNIIARRLLQLGEDR
jgi:alkylation response protein AidB-like acyl-CoA dehydrogenase